MSVAEERRPPLPMRRGSEFPPSARVLGDAAVAPPTAHRNNLAKLGHRAMLQLPRSSCFPVKMMVLVLPSAARPPEEE